MVDKMMVGAPCLKAKTPNYAIKGTAVKIQLSSDSSAAAVPYFGC